MAGGKGGGDQITGYKYFMGLHMGLFRGPVNSVTRIIIGDKIAWSGSVEADATITIDKPDLFGGDEKEGGIKGTLRVMMGTPTQVAWPALVTMLKGKVPGFRGIVSLFYDGQICSNNPYPKPWKIQGIRTTAGWHNDTPWYPERAEVPMRDTEDPTQIVWGTTGAHIIYECLTNPEWSMGASPDLLNEPSFISCANQLFDEDFGLCFIWDRASNVRDFVGVVLDHIGAALYVDRLTGLETLKLIRDDYDPETLPEFTTLSGILEIEDDDAGAADNTVNEVVIKYHHEVSDQERTVRKQNLASRQANGAATPLTLDFPGIAVGSLATRIAARELKMRTLPLKRFKLRIDRRGSGLRPASVFRFTDTAREISMIVRVVTIEEPGPIANEFVVRVVQDVFGFPATTYTVVQPPMTPETNFTPEAPEKVYVREWSYRDLVRMLPPAERATIADTSGAAYAVVRRSTVNEQDYELWSRADGETEYARRSTGAFAPWAALDTAVGLYDTTFSYLTGDDLTSPTLPCAALIDGEIVRVDAIDEDLKEITVARGCQDTVPQVHADGATLLFLDGYQTVDTREYIEGDEIHVRVLPRTATQLYPFDTAADYLLPIVARHLKPLPPADLQVNGTPYGEVSNVAGLDAVFTWVERNRLVQMDTLVGHNEATVAAEAGTTYNVRVMSGSTLVRETTGIAVSTYTYSQADWVADGSIAALTFMVESERDTVVSFTRYVVRLRFDTASLASSAAGLARRLLPLRALRKRKRT